ncbi:MAG: thiamine-phosphate pyrophosphorylase [Micromonosporaceae bacterium]|nr:thiamine-phosphate pyrophosphorylase [Micromonosporaceae bacterium]
MVIVFTDRRQARRPLPDVVRAAVDGGARLVVLRERDLPAGERAALAARLRAVLAAVGGRLLVAGHDHLGAADPWPAVPPALVGRSCHDARELAVAAAEGAGYATISPVFASRSKPGYGPPLGLDGLASLCAGARLPVYALGGVETADQVGACRHAGAAGVAVMGVVMRAPDPAAVVAELADADAEADADAQADGHAQADADAGTAT